MGFSKQDYWSGLPCPPPGDLPDPGIEPESLMPPALEGKSFTTNTIWEAPVDIYLYRNTTQSLKKEWNFIACNNMDRFGGLSEISQRQIPCDITYIEI